jgi:alkylhydroperoxidase family enzyme
MTWIKVIPLSEANERLRSALQDQRALYPVKGGETSGIVASHSLIPDALFHAFATFGSLMSADLPLSRRQHEMIATMVSVTNRCFY